MGYDLERFVGYVNEGLLCCVCRDVLEDPLQAPCEHAFCSSCIHGWLVHHNTCPEDRLPLDITHLRPLFRYMRNYLAKLQVRCVFRPQGCEVTCALESVHRHELQCDYALLNCSNAGCPVQVSRRSLEAHLCVCEYSSRYTILNTEEAQHKCVSDLRAELDMLRAELDCKVEEVRHEMESHLDSQRRHMVQKESLLRCEVDELKGQLSRVMSDVRVLLAAERARRRAGEGGAGEGRAS
ncbi:E3 ubiquitin-protein ligase NRDP1-like [Sinocyclocheilus rhinocerous]|uniref:E3 ubiquitin-protein ligase NRDP1-like n=1 Tax=Sinocyclocheilus rhinocerous TaxID=307959 RepID=UPI0007B7A5EA|nr:PREDICTED: E3 ubiquitin-protein ligase NRDP1-like [Sinocyclocheilus rhinocerous]